MLRYQKLRKKESTNCSFFYFKTFHFYNIVSISLLNEIINCVQRKNQDMYTESCWKMCLITVYWLWIIRSLEIHYPWSILEITLSAPPDDSTNIYLLIKGCQSPKPIKVFKKSLKEYTCEVILLSLMNNSVHLFSNVLNF